MKNWFFLIVLLVKFSGCTKPAEEEATTVVTAANVDVLFIGHSQVNHQMPGYFQWLSEAGSQNITSERQVIGGGNLEENYVLSYQSTDTQNPSTDPDSKYLYFSGRISNKGVSARASIEAGPSHLIFTEEHGLVQAQARSSSSFQSSYGISFPAAENVDASADNFLLSLYQSTYELGSGLSFYHETVTANPNANIYLYENFFPVVNGSTHCTRLTGSQTVKTLGEINSWRKRIYTYSNVWQGLATEINNQRGQSASGFTYGAVEIPQTTIANGMAVEVIPVARALSVLVERICAQQVATLTNPNELWFDHVHASELGNYFIALVMYAAIHNQSPYQLSLSGDGLGRGLDDSNLSIPNTEVALAMQQIAQDVVSGTASANNTDIATCPGIDNQPQSTELICVDSSDTETIPQY